LENALLRFRRKARAKFDTRFLSRKAFVFLCGFAPLREISFSPVKTQSRKEGSKVNL